MITRFAPSPTGPLHLGHAFSALTAFDLAREQSGQFLLRIEDIDQSRARAAWEVQVYDDLHWLGLSWPTPVLRQSDRLASYRAALSQLWERGLLYPCHCTRADIAAAASAPQEGAPLLGPDGVIYPGTCRAQPRLGTCPDGALRLDMAKALVTLPNPIRWKEMEQGTQAMSHADLITKVGDVVLARRDMGTSYHLAVALDDAKQGITHVVRGKDLAEATPIHVVLQHLLDLPTPIYHHHRLIRDDSGKRLAKRDDARALSVYRAAGEKPSDIRHMVGLST